MQSAMHGVMRKFVLLLLTVFFLYSCASTGDEPVDEIVVIEDEALPETEPSPIEPEVIEEVEPEVTTAEELPVE